MTELSIGYSGACKAEVDKIDDLLATTRSKLSTLRPFTKDAKESKDAKDAKSKDVAAGQNSKTEAGSHSLLK